MNAAFGDCDEGDGSTQMISTDEFTDLLDVVRSASILAGAADRDHRHLRCIFTELANAFGAAMICALTQTYGGGPWHRDDEARLLTYINASDGSPPPQGMRVASLRILWARAKDPNWMANWGGTAIATHPRRDELVAWSIALRDDFQHFSPKRLGIDRADFLDAMEELATLIGELSDHSAFMHRVYGPRKDELQANLTTIIAVIAGIRVSEFRSLDQDSA